jgi:putative oxidoreductase
MPQDGKTMSKLQALFAVTPRDYGVLVLRLFFGITLALAHGWGKLGGLGAFTDVVASKGVPLPSVLAPAAALSEVVGGLLMAIGLFTRPAAVVVLTTMLVAGFYIHAADPFMKKELAFAYAAAARSVVLSGPGRFSVDSRLA